MNKQKTAIRLAADTQLNAANVAQPLPRVRRGRKPAVVLASIPPALVLSDAETRIVLAYRKTCQSHQEQFIKAVEGIAAALPRHPISALRLVRLNGGVA